MKQELEKVPDRIKKIIRGGKSATDRIKFTKAAQIHFTTLAGDVGLPLSDYCSLYTTEKRLLYFRRTDLQEYEFQKGEVSFCFLLVRVRKRNFSIKFATQTSSGMI